MKKVFGLLCISALSAWLASCADVDSRNNPTDPMADNYVADVLDKSSSSVVSGDSDIPNENAESSSSDDSGNGSNKDEQVSSSSVISNDGDGSSSSVLSGSSSSECNSSVVSSSSTDVNSSSSVVQGSSSSVVLESSSSSEEITCGADKPNWIYLNSDIEYGCIQDSRDNQYYKTVKIGSQVWMAENLNYYSNTDPYVAAYSRCYMNENANCETYGRLYTWTAAMNIAATNATNSYSAQKNHQGLCPDGFHIPTNNEIGTLLETASADDLKSMFLWEAGYTGSDKYGFAALPGGFAEKDSDYGYDEMDKTMSIWTTKEKDATKVYIGILYAQEENMINTQNTGKSGLNSVRCLKDSD